MSIEAIQKRLEKGPALTAADVNDIRYELALLPHDEAHEAEPWIWEAVALIVTDPDYKGDARVPG